MFTLAFFFLMMLVPADFSFMGILQDPFSATHSSRGIFCSRTLNLRSISAIGYDMDYTLVHYNVEVTVVLLLLSLVSAN